MNFLDVIKKDPTIIELLNENYPDLNIDALEESLLKDVIESIIGDSLDDLSKLLNPNTHIPNQKELDENYELADKLIPEMLIPANMIYLNGKINNIPIKILLDTGAGSSCIFKSKAIDAGLDNIVDKRFKREIHGINSAKETYGTILYTEIELQLNNNREGVDSTAMIGLNLDVVDDQSGEDNLKDFPEKRHSFDVILGLNFMKSYGTVIDFKTNTITLNNTIKIKFD